MSFSQLPMELKREIVSYVVGATVADMYNGRELYYWQRRELRSLMSIDKDVWQLAGELLWHVRHFFHHRLMIAMDPEVRDSLRNSAYSSGLVRKSFKMSIKNWMKSSHSGQGSSRWAPSCVAAH